VLFIAVTLLSGGLAVAVAAVVFVALVVLDSLGLEIEPAGTLPDGLLPNGAEPLEAGPLGAEAVDPLKRDSSDLGLRMDAISLRTLRGIF
jgi:hypothetical protein